ncbi:MAG: dihydroxyacetone kinase subunit DhaK [Curvibacter sp.]|jgi:dihydroxyacetone kinase-like protein|nr:dihydroxyacetone kinase subunit DhaK [Curvibacter sp.]
MKKFLNRPENFVLESVSGFAESHADFVAMNPAPLYLRRRSPKRKGVAVISGGGSGHEPLDIGYVGTGMLDAACPGAVFTAPTPGQVVAAAESVARADGVVLIVKNYVGDLKSFELARDMLDLPVSWVLVNDDVAGVGPDHPAGRRGIAGTVIVEKIVGAAAERGMSLTDCKRVGDKANQATATMSVALTSCSVPGAAATFEIGAHEMEMGVGLHGEPGRTRIPTMSANEIASALVEQISEDLQFRQGGAVLLFTNGLGGTPLGELYLLHAAARAELMRRGVEVKRSLVGNYATSLESAGASLSVCTLDDELLGLWDAPVRTVALRW